MEKRKISEFEKDVYDAVRKIPKGNVATYAQIAAMSGHRGAARAVGNALHNNPDPATIPCHRVVAASGKLADAFVFGGVGVQAQRLRAEGVTVGDGDTVDLLSFNGVGEWGGETGMNEEFWQALDKIVDRSEIVIDRPRGSRHPRFPHIVYEIDYGYLGGTSSSDGAGIDVWIGKSGDKKVVGVVCTVDTLKRDSEIKILLGLDEDEIAYVNRFHNETQSMKGLLVRRYI